MSDTFVGMLKDDTWLLKLLFGVSPDKVCAHVIITQKADGDLGKEVSWLKYVCPLEAFMPELTKTNMLQLVTDHPVLTTVDMHMKPVVDSHSEKNPAKVFKGAVRIPVPMLAMLWSYMHQGEGRMPPWVSNGKHDLPALVQGYVCSVVPIPDMFIGGGHLIQAIASGRLEACDRDFNAFADKYSFHDHFHSQEHEYNIIKGVAASVMQTLQTTQEPVSLNAVLEMFSALHSQNVPVKHLLELQLGLTNAIHARAVKAIPATNAQYSSKHYVEVMVKKDGLQALATAPPFKVIVFMLMGKLPDSCDDALKACFDTEWKKFNAKTTKLYDENEPVLVRNVTKIICGWVTQFMTSMQCPNSTTLLPVITGNFTMDKGFLMRLQAGNPHNTSDAKWKTMFWLGLQLLQLFIIVEPCGDLGLVTRNFTDANWDEIVAGLVGVPAAGTKRDHTGSIPPDLLPLRQFEPEFRQWLLQGLVNVVRARGSGQMRPGLKFNEGLIVSDHPQLIPKLLAHGLKLPEKDTHRILDLAPPAPAPPGSSGPGAGAAPVPTGAAAGMHPAPTGAATGPSAAGPSAAPGPMVAAVVPNPGAVWDGTDASLRALGWQTIEKSKDLDGLLHEAILLTRNELHKSALFTGPGLPVIIAFNGDEKAVPGSTIVRFLAREIKGWTGQLYFEQPLTLKHMLKLGVGIHPSFDWRNQNVPKYITNNAKSIRSPDPKAKFKSFMATKLQALYDHDQSLACFRNADPAWRDFFLQDEAYYNDVYRDGK